MNDTKDQLILMQQFIEKLQDGITLLCWNDKEHDLFVREDSVRSEELKDIELLLAKEGGDINTQLDIIEDFNDFIEQSCCWYVMDHYEALEKRHKYDSSVDQARFMEGLG